MALIHRETIKTSVIQLGKFDEFESLAVKLVSSSSSVVVVCIYRPPGPADATFISCLSDLFDQLLLMDVKFVVCGDFNTPGSGANPINDDVADVFLRYNLTQHVACRHTTAATSLTCW